MPPHWRKWIWKDNIAANPGREAYGGREECSASVGAFGIPWHSSDMLWGSGLLGWFLEQDCWLCGVTYLSTTSLSLMPLKCHCCMSNILYSNVATHMSNFTLDHFGLATSVTSFPLSSLTDFASIPHTIVFCNQSWFIKSGNLPGVWECVGFMWEPWVLCSLFFCFFSLLFSQILLVLLM